MRFTVCRAAMFGFALVVATAGCGRGAASVGEPPADLVSVSESTPTSYLGLPVQRARHVTVFDNLGFGGFPLVDTERGRLWSGSPGGLGWIDPKTGAAHQVDDIPGVYLAVYGDSLYRTAWAFNEVARYDVSGEPLEAARRRAPSPLNIAAGPEGVWASDHNHGNLLRLDPETVRVVKKVKIGSGDGYGPAGLVWHGRDLWVNVKRDATLALVDGRTGAVQRKIEMDGIDIGDDLSLTSAGLWAAVYHEDDSLEWELVDTQTARVEARLDAGNGFSATPVEVDGQIWFPIDDLLVHLDPNRGWQPDRAVELGVDAAPRFAAVGFGSVWISTVDPNRIVRVDLADLQTSDD